MIGIDELGEACERHHAESLGWFTALGAWVVGEPDPVRQRLFAEAAHRHAWHAGLWADRRPRIPPESLPEMPSPVSPAVDDADRAGSYRAALASMRDDLARLRGLVDPELDPATARVVDLVDRDLADVETRLR